MAESSFRFRPKARILRLLGDQLIGSPRLAIFELVKNSYDADAQEVSVRLENLGSEDAKIIVRDDGEGMDSSTIQNVWFVPGADHREKQRQEGRRSPRFHRLPLGEKGLGRFAVHKLGNEIRLVTRHRESNQESVVDIDWKKLLDDRFLEELEVKVEQREPESFPGSSHGTEISIKDLRQDSWSRGDLRRLYRQVMSICSPFKAPREFRVSLEAPGRDADFAGLPSIQDILNRAFWRYTFALDESGFSWEYTFTNQLSGVNIANRSASGDNELLPLDDDGDEPAEEAIPRPRSRRTNSDKVRVDAEFLKGIGPISGEIYIFDRDREVLSRMAEPDLLSRFLTENGGIRVYRDGIRVYNYGERGDDWLGLDLRRVNQPTRRISRNVVLGAINIELGVSSGLVEKTNREGFVEDANFSKLRRIVLATIAALEAEREPDKDRLRKAVGRGEPDERFDAQPPIAKLRREAKRLGVDTELEKHIRRIEEEFDSLRQTLLNVGMSGVGLAVVFHEIDRGVRELYAAIRDGRQPSALEQRALELSELLDGFSTLLRKSDKKLMSASSVIRQARDIAAPRFRFHNTRLYSPVLSGEQKDFEADMPRGLVLGALTNLIDNALYWLRVRHPDTPSDAETNPRKVYIGTTHDIDAGPAIIVADSGVGFRDPPELLAKPFFTRRPDGMGLGLYYVKLAMEIAGGSLQFPSAADVGLPEEYSGAVIALVFNKA
jgi:signal transduction histidine kinase